MNIADQLPVSVMIIGICHEYGFMLVPLAMFIRYMPARFILCMLCMSCCVSCCMCCMSCANAVAQSASSAVNRFIETLLGVGILGWVARSVSDTKNVRRLGMRRGCKGRFGDGGAAGGVRRRPDGRFDDRDQHHRNLRAQHGRLHVIGAGL